MQEISASRFRFPPILKLLLKIAVSGLCIGYISGKIDFAKAGATFQKANWFLLAGALLAYIVSKLVAAFRLNIYFRNAGIHLPEVQNIRLYWLGMFYNLFLPGAIGGDAYKVLLLSRRGTNARKTTGAVLLDRFSGLLGLGLLLAAFAPFLLPFSWCLLVVVGAVMAVLLLYIVIRRWLTWFLPSFGITLLLGVLVQLIQVGAAWLIMCSLGISAPYSGYLFLFLLSSAVSVLPLTIGGLGIRELVFVEGAAWFGIPSQEAVAVSLLFYLITLVSSAWGLVYLYRSPLPPKEKDPLQGPHSVSV